MSDVATTNLILAVIAGAILLQSLLLVAVLWWAKAQVATLRARIDGLDMPRLLKRTHDALDDFHALADTASRAGLAVERTANGVHAVVDVAGHEVRRATMGVRMAFDVVGALAGRAAAVRAGLVAGLSEFLSGRREKRQAEEAVAAFVSEGGHD